ncbi:MAG TPA: Hsp20/alpha crystallin family protein [Spirochaetia bacterium]|nr:Hsp20/alpha crystallin family protein [Spirochaetia bacterium]
MDFEKINQMNHWMDFAQKSKGKDFWSWVFNDPQHKEGLQQVAQLFSADTSFPKADVLKSDSHMVVVMEIPGVRKEDIQLSVEGDHLSVKGVVNSPHSSYTLIANERFHGPFERVIHLPEVASKEGTSAKFENGLLIVSMLRGNKAYTQNIRID